MDEQITSKAIRNKTNLGSFWQARVPTNRKADVSTTIHNIQSFNHPIPVV